VGRTPLRWAGAGSLGFGLDGVVELDAYRAMFGTGGCRHPLSGRRLVEVRRPGFVLTVAANKTIAVLDVLGRSEDMHAIVDAETNATMDWLDRWFQQRGGSRGRAAVRTRTGGLAYAVTRTATSRAGDPSPHDHVLVANVVEMLDAKGGFKGLDGAALRDNVEAATMVGRLWSAARAIELGYAIEPVAGPSGRRRSWRIVGIPHRVCVQFSKRSEQIDKHLATVGYHGHRARSVAARATRRGHVDAGPFELRAGWHDELATAGVPAEVVESELAQARQQSTGVPSEVSDDQIEWLAADLLGAGGPLARRNAFSRGRLIAELAPRLYGYVPESLDRAVERILGSDRVRLLEPRQRVREPVYGIFGRHEHSAVA
jgi:conjugative relaxase-like TrwC/TraI family protein